MTCTTVYVKDVSTSPENSNTPKNNIDIVGIENVLFADQKFYIKVINFLPNFKILPFIRERKLDLKQSG